jgi:hypothetical protein
MKMSRNKRRRGEGRFSIIGENRRDLRSWGGCSCYGGACRKDKRRSSDGAEEQIHKQRKDDRERRRWNQFTILAIVMPGRHTGTQAGGWAVRQAIQAVGGIMVLCQEKRKRIETTPPKSRAAD